MVGSLDPGRFEKVADQQPETHQEAKDGDGHPQNVGYGGKGGDVAANERGVVAQCRRAPQAFGIFGIKIMRYEKNRQDAHGGGTGDVKDVKIEPSVSMQTFGHKRLLPYCLPIVLPNGKRGAALRHEKRLMRSSRVLIGTFRESLGVCNQ